MASFPPVPANLKAISHYLKVAAEHDERNPVISYWARIFALQTGLKLSSKKPEETQLLIAMMDWLEKFKKEHHDNEAITTEVVAQAHLENYACKLFDYADQQDRAANFSKNVVKAYYTAGVIYDVLQTFGDLSEESTQNRKYAKYKAAYIHNCLKNGETPIPGPLTEGGEDAPKDDNEDVVVGAPSAGSRSGSIDNNEHAGPSQPTPPSEPANDSPNNEFRPTLIDINPDKFPSPPVDPEITNPGGFKPFEPSSATAIPIPSYPQPDSNVKLTADQMAKAQKYCKYAGSALNYDDVKSAIENLQNALHLLTTGQEK